MGMNEELNIHDENFTEKISDKINEAIENKNKCRNRAERRRFTRKVKRQYLKNKDLIKTASEKLAYIEMIERIRKMREEIEKNEQATYEED